MSITPLFLTGNVVVTFSITIRRITDLVSVKIKITNKTMEFSLACKYQTEAKRTIKISLGWVSAEATFNVVSKGS